MVPLEDAHNHVRAPIKGPCAKMKFYSDILTKKQLLAEAEDDWEFLVSLSSKISQLRDRFYQAHTSKALLTGYAFLDRTRLDPKEDLGPHGFDEKDAHKRHVTWLREAHDFIFGISVEFNGREWVKKNDQEGTWNRLAKWARRADQDHWKDVEEYRDYIRSHPVEVQAGREARSRYFALYGVARRTEMWQRKKDRDEDFGYFCFQRENIPLKLKHIMTDERTVRQLIEEKKLEIKEEKVYRIDITEDGMKEFDRLAKSIERR